jgi:hypothetical protein
LNPIATRTNQVVDKDIFGTIYPLDVLDAFQ